MAQKIVYTQTNPLSIRAGHDQVFSGFPINAWTDADAPGGIRIQINCQNHPIDKWKKDCKEIVTRHVQTVRNPINVNELNALLFEDDEDVIKEKFTALVKLKKDVNKGDIAFIKKICNGMEVAIAAIEAMVAPGKKAKVKKEVDAVKAV